MSDKKTKGLWASILGMKCPRCRLGDLFETPTFSFQKSFEMPSRCPHCRQKYVLEPGFYYGAMFISYILSGWFCLGLIGLFMLVLGWSVWTSFGVLLIICAILFVWFFRISRSLYIHIWVKYNPKYSKINEGDSPKDS